MRLDRFERFGCVLASDDHVTEALKLPLDQRTDVLAVVTTTTVIFMALGPLHDPFHRRHGPFGPAAPRGTAAFRRGVAITPRLRASSGSRAAR
jgi:hypothetical protein